MSNVFCWIWEIIFGKLTSEINDVILAIFNEGSRVEYDFPKAEEESFWYSTKMAGAISLIWYSTYLNKTRLQIIDIASLNNWWKIQECIWSTLVVRELTI